MGYSDISGYQFSYNLSMIGSIDAASGYSGYCIVLDNYSDAYIQLSASVPPSSASALDSAVVFTVWRYILPTEISYAKVMSHTITTKTYDCYVGDVTNASYSPNIYDMVLDDGTHGNADGASVPSSTKSGIWRPHYYVGASTGVWAISKNGNIKSVSANGTNQLVLLGINYKV